MGQKPKSIVLIANEIADWEVKRPIAAPWFKTLDYLQRSLILALLADAARLGIEQWAQEQPARTSREFYGA